MSATASSPKICMSNVKKKTRWREKCHDRTMMYSEDDKSFIMNEHHVSFRQIVGEIRLERKGGKKNGEVQKKNQNTDLKITTTKKVNPSETRRLTSFVCLF